MTQGYDTLILVNNTKFNVINTKIYDFGEPLQLIITINEYW